MAVKPPTNPKSMIADKNALREVIARLAERLGIVPDPTLTPQKVREMMIADGIQPERNEFSREIIRARYEEE
jgi:hypothetical protein